MPQCGTNEKSADEIGGFECLLYDFVLRILITPGAW